MTRMIAIGNEEFVMGFELVGIQGYPLSDLEKYFSKSEDIGIIVLNQNDYNTLSLKIKNQIDKMLKPIVVILSDSDIKGSNLREMIIKSLGVDLLKE